MDQWEDDGSAIIKALREGTKEDLEASIFTWINSNPHDIPIGSFCRHGGWPDDIIEGSIMSVDKDPDGGATVKVSVFFTELVPSSCADQSFPEPASGVFVFHIDSDSQFYVTAEEDWEE